MHDAVVAAKLNDAGAVLVGKTGLHELAYGITSNNPHFGAVHNPWDLERIPGGSSGGSGAAVAADMVPMATGTDTGGSIRIPASFCGTVGLKPTYERVSRRGVLPLGLTLDHIGPMARTVRDAAVVFHAMVDASERLRSAARRSIFADCASGCRRISTSIGWIWKSRARCGPRCRPRRRWARASSTCACRISRRSTSSDGCCSWPRRCRSCVRISNGAPISAPMCWRCWIRAG